MATHYQELLEQLETSLNDLNGDILALDIFFRCYESVVEGFGDSVSSSYLQRLKDYIDQHMQEIQKITGILSKGISFDLNSDAKTGWD